MCLETAERNGWRFHPFLAHAVPKLRVIHDFALALILKRKAIIAAPFDRVKQVFGVVGTNQIAPHIGHPHFVIDEFKRHRIADATRVIFLVTAIGIHLQNRCPNLFFFNTSIATTAH